MGGGGCRSSSRQPQVVPVLYLVLSLLPLILASAYAVANQDDCNVSNCKHHGPDIRFPFRLKEDRQHSRCGYAGLELSCTEKKETKLELPFSGAFLVKAIDYRSQLMETYDPQGCIIKRLLRLNFSASPFHQTPSPQLYYGDGIPAPDFVHFIIILNCSSTELIGKAQRVNCLEVSGYQVYAVHVSDDQWLQGYMPPPSCRKVRTISVPFSDHFLSHINDPDLSIFFSWKSPNCSYCEEKGKRCTWKNHTSGSRIQCLDIPTKGVSIGQVVTGVSVGLLLLMIAITIYLVYNSKLSKQDQARIEKFLDDYKALRPRRYSYADIKRITNQFNEKLGQGGYGSVFKGKLSNEILVAVKVLNYAKGNGDEFINEVSTIGRIHHVNVVRLVGFCADGFRRALVYEFLPNESLEKFIFSKNANNPFLNWEKLQKIAIGIARGMEYLHQGCDQRILHFDIKPHNILLDHNFNPKISDFGLAKLCSKDKSIVSMTAARGTMGYIAPEVFSRNFGNVSYKSDVYSFGMLLLEMVGGRKNIDATEEKTSQVYFPEWVYNHLSQGEEMEIRVIEDGDAKIAKKLTIVALWCIQWYPVDRPSMNVVVQMLEGEAERLIMPPNPFASTTKENTNAVNPKMPFHIGLTVIDE